MTSSFASLSPAAAPMPLVLLPGTSCDERLFAPLRERLPGREAHCLPLIGDTIAAAAVNVLAQAPRRFTLLGFSLGGFVAIEVALRAPERVAGLALIDSNARACAADARGPHAASPLAAVALAWPRYVAATRQNDGALRSSIDAMARAVDPKRHREQQRLVRERADRRGDLAHLCMPTLVAAGAEDALCPPAMQGEMADRLPDATVALIAGVGHFAPLEAPDLFAAHVAAWLARVDAAAATPALPNYSILTIKEAV